MDRIKSLLIKYCNLLAGKSFNIDFNGKHDPITLSFRDVNFPHLTGIKYCFEPKEQKNLDGKNGVDNISNDLITVDICKQKNFKNYQKYVEKKLSALEKFLDPVEKVDELQFDCCFFNKSRVIQTMAHLGLDDAKFIIKFTEGPTCYILMFGFFGKNHDVIEPYSIRKCGTEIIDYLDCQDFIKGKVKFR